MDRGHADAFQQIDHEIQIGFDCPAFGCDLAGQPLDCRRLTDRSGTRERLRLQFVERADQQTSHRKWFRHRRRNRGNGVVGAPNTVVNLFAEHKHLRGFLQHLAQRDQKQDLLKTTAHTDPVKGDIHLRATIHVGSRQLQVDALGRRVHTPGA